MRRRTLGLIWGTPCQQTDGPPVDGDNPGAVLNIHPLEFIDGQPTIRVNFRVRYAECDAFGYLHHARYWEYFEQTRTELLRAAGIRYRDLESQGVYFVVHKCACKYVRAVRYDDLVTVAARVVRTTHTRVDHTYLVQRDDVVTCEASTTLACVDRDGKPRAMPERLWIPSRAN